MPKRGLSDDYYTVDGAKTLLHDDEKTLRREYTRLRILLKKEGNDLKKVITLGLKLLNRRNSKN